MRQGEVEREALPAGLREVVDSFGGELYFAARDFTTGGSLGFRSREPVQTASVIKLPVMMEAFFQVREGRLDLNRRIRFEEANRVPGAGILQDLGAGLEITLLDAVTLMVVLSDNSATNVVIDQVGVDSVNRRLDALGLVNTRLNKKVYLPGPADLPPERARFGLGVTTAAEMLQWLERLYRREMVDGESSGRMIELMRKQRDREQIPRLLTGPEWEGVSVANKTGALDRVRNDVGLVFTPDGDFALSLFAQNSPDQKWTPENEATLTLARLAKAILEHFRHSRPQG